MRSPGMNSELIILNDEHENSKVSGVRSQVSGLRKTVAARDFAFPET
jgi:hypothetical protein